MRKHLLGQFELLDRDEVESSALVQDLLAWTADQKQILAKFPPAWSLAQLRTVIDLDPVLASMWECLFRPVIRRGEEAVKLFTEATNHEACLAIIRLFKKRTGYPPTPHALARLLLDDPVPAIHKAVARERLKSRWKRCALETEEMARKRARNGQSLTAARSGQERRWAREECLGQYGGRCQCWYEG